MREIYKDVNDADLSLNRSLVQQNITPLQYTEPQR